jgi:hypothetical protein
MMNVVVILVKIIPELMLLIFFMVKKCWAVLWRQFTIFILLLTWLKKFEQVFLIILLTNLKKEFLERYQRGNRE